MTSSPLPLHDVRVIAIEQFGAGPFGTVQLADLGADVIKIENPSTGGDVGRYVPPYTAGEDSLFFEVFNRNKRSIGLDLETDAGRRVFEDLVRHSDVVFSNLRGDVPGKLRIRYDDLKHLNPAIVCCSLSAFGMTGPRSAQPGYDYVMQGLTGWMSLTGEPDGPPTKTGLSLVDFGGGLVAAIALLAGLHAARRDGIGMDCDVSLFDTAISLLNYPATWHLTAGFAPVRTARSAHPSMVPFQNFPTGDGWIVIACPKEKFWQRLVDVLGRPDLAADPRFDSFESRRRNHDALTAILDDLLSTKPAGEWVDVLTSAGVPCAPVNDIERAMADAHTAARGMIVQTPHPAWGTVRQIGSPVKVGPPRREHRPAPGRDADRDDVLREVLGYSDEQCRELDIATRSQNSSHE
jgi:crotonobetainyl-CoA:carnitine CoA-transferase CaiB-like acyl-CoA transferase